MDQLAAVISVDSTKIRILHKYRLLNIRFRLVSSRLILEARVKLNENKTTNKQTNKQTNKRSYETCCLDLKAIITKGALRKCCNFKLSENQTWPEQKYGFTLK